MTSIGAAAGARGPVRAARQLQHAYRLAKRRHGAVMADGVEVAA
jgi:hypothetical protein